MTTTVCFLCGAKAVGGCLCCYECSCKNDDCMNPRMLASVYCVSCDKEAKKIAEAKTEKRKTVAKIKAIRYARCTEGKGDIFTCPVNGCTNKRMMRTPEQENLFKGSRSFLRFCAECKCRSENCQKKVFYENGLCKSCEKRRLGRITKCENVLCNNTARSGERFCGICEWANDVAQVEPGFKECFEQYLVDERLWLYGLGLRRLKIWCNSPEKLKESWELWVSICMGDTPTTPVL